MSLNTTIANWTKKVPSRQWAKEDSALAEIGAETPHIIADSKPLSEVHRLDLSLFVIFEEAALRVSGALVRSAPTLESMNFAAQQTLDEARHHEIFLSHLERSCRVIDLTEPVVTEAIKTPPLRRFLELCDEVIDKGDFIEGLALMNLVFEGMAYPLYAYEERYWRKVDPYLAALINSAFADESRHVGFGAKIVHNFLKDDPSRKARVVSLCDEATLLMHEVFKYYVRKFVRLFDHVGKLHKDEFAGTEFKPGKLVSETPYEEQIAAIHASIQNQHELILTRAGLD